MISVDFKAAVVTAGAATVGADVLITVVVCWTGMDDAVVGAGEATVDVDDSKRTVLSWNRADVLDEADWTMVVSGIGAVDVVVGAGGATVDVDNWIGVLSAGATTVVGTDGRMVVDAGKISGVVVSAAGTKVVCWTAAIVVMVTLPQALIR